MNSDKIQLYKEYFRPPEEWKLKDAIAYRKALGGYTKGGELKRFAPIGNIDMGKQAPIPDSFPFYAFTGVEEPSDEEILRRGDQILQMLNKYDPYADKTFMNVKFENVEIPDISLLDELMKPEVRPKDPVVAYLQSLPEKPGPRLNIKSDANSYQTAGYDIDRLVNWTSIPKSNSKLAGVHRALIVNAGNYLLQLALEHEEEKECIRECIDYELKQYMRYGTNGKYVHRYNINAVVDAMGKTPSKETKSVKIVTSERDPKTGRWRDTSRYEDRDMSEKSWLLDGVIKDNNTYKMFNKVLDIDAKGHKKWKKYIKRKMKLYNRYMSKTVRVEDMDKDLWTGGRESDYKFDTLASGAAKKAEAARQARIKRKPPPPPLRAARAAADAQLNAVEEYINKVGKIKSKQELDDFLSTTDRPDTNLIGIGVSDQISRMYDAVRKKMEELEKSSVSTPSSQSSLRPSDLTTEQDFRDQLERNRQEYDRLLPLNDDASKKRKNKIMKVQRDLMKEITRLVKEQEEADKNQEIIDNTATAPANASPEPADPSPVQGDDALRPSDSQGAIDLEPEPEPKFKVGDCVKYNASEIGTVNSVNVTTSEVVIKPYTAPTDNNKPFVTKKEEDVEFLESKDCDDLKFKVRLSFSIKVKQQEAERKRKEEAAKKLKEDQEAEAKRLADEKIKELNALPQLVIGTPVGNWTPLLVDKEVKFYASRLTYTNNERLVKLIRSGKIPENKHVLQYKLIEHKKEMDMAVLKIYDKEYRMDKKLDDGGENDLLEDDRIIITKNMGPALKDSTYKVSNRRDMTILKIKDQAVIGLKALHGAGLVHQDIKLDNMAWDGKNLTIIDLGNTVPINEACETTFNGDTMNILPPPEFGNAYLADYWSLTLALLNLGGKNLQAEEEVEEGGGSSSITEILFTAGGKQAKGNCAYQLGANSRQKSLLFRTMENDRETLTIKRREFIENIVKKYGHSIFDYLWFVFLNEGDLSTKNAFLPGYVRNPANINPGGNKDELDYIKILTSRMSDTRQELCKEWVEGHLRWKELQSKLTDVVYTATKEKILNKNAAPPQFEKSEFVDIGKEFYGIKTVNVVKIFEMLSQQMKSSILVNTSDRSSYLDYDSFSDTELNELEAELDMYTDDEFDRMMEGAVTGMGKDDLSYDSMSDSSLPSSNAISYNSSSDAAYSYDSSSDTGLSGLAASYNSESEQSYQNSEHDASYDSESDEDS